MTVLTVAGDEASSDQLRDLRAWLVEEDELRGHVRSKERPPTPGSLGPVLEALEVLAQPAAGVLAASLVAWLRSRVSRFRLEVRTERGARMALDVRQVKQLDPRAAEELISRLSAVIGGEQADGGSDAAEPPNGRA